MPPASPTTRAGLITRLTAYAIDAAILSLAVAIASWLLDVAARAAHRFSPPIDLSAVLLASVPLVIVVYHVGFWCAWGQTPGKWVMGIRVVPIRGGRLGVARCLVRLFGYLLSTAPLYLGFAWILGPQRRGWHDRLARTEVVHIATQPAGGRIVTTTPP